MHSHKENRAETTKKVLFVVIRECFTCVFPAFFPSHRTNVLVTQAKGDLIIITTSTTVQMVNSSPV